MAPEASQIQLPINLIDTTDINRAKREVEALAEFLDQASIREPGKQPAMPRTSKTLEELARINKLNLLIADQRQQVLSFLEYLQQKAPNIHISFATDPSAAFLGKIVQWFRAEVHPHTLVHVGLQPSIAAGCIVRTPNKYFDLSLRQHFNQNRQSLLDSLEGLKSE
ncbi:MAG: hypothetical protein JWS12_905 [Candidatus Saccharibacteria bacterium]|nr:hypothetical protein [Candidatus Saccharibacteria bacterium]